MSYLKFKKISLEDRKKIESITSGYSPYSDYNFTSLWCWDTNKELQIAFFRTSLIVKFTDYITGEPFYSFMGDGSPQEVYKEIISILEYSRERLYVKLVPEGVANSLQVHGYNISQDRDNFDYIFLLPTLINYTGNRLRAKRNYLHRFKRFYPEAKSRILDLSDLSTKKAVVSTFFSWSSCKHIDQEEITREYSAISNLLSHSRIFNLVSLGVFFHGKMIGFSINEVLNNNYSILHFEKADYKTYIGIYPYIMSQTARILFEKYSSMYLNYEQDLGIEGLRKAKISYMPSFFLKKYTINSERM